MTSEPQWPSARKDIIFVDRFKDMAVVRTEATWGVDYIGLAKFNGKWKIINVLWRQYDNEEGRHLDEWHPNKSTQANPD